MQGSHTLVSVDGAFLQTGRQKITYNRWNQLQIKGRGRIIMDDPMRGRQGVIPDKWMSTGNRFVHHHTQAEQVTERADLLTCYLFRRHIGRRNQNAAGWGEFLAGAHAAVMRPAGGPFLCIDCHGGVGLLGRARVKVLAGKDAFWWAVGHFEEPTGMRWPLWDADCRQCHPNFGEGTDATSANPPFHALGVHNVELGVSCVECHLSHETGGGEDLYHLRPVRVRAQCARCHAEFG